MSVRCIRSAILGCCLLAAWAIDRAVVAAEPVLIAGVKSADGVRGELRAMAGTFATISGMDADLRDYIIQRQLTPDEEEIAGEASDQPAAMYVTSGVSGSEFSAVRLVPVRDESEFFKPFVRFGVKTAAQGAGLYTLAVTTRSGPQKGYLRFANGHAYFLYLPADQFERADRFVIDTLPDPGDVLSEAAHADAWIMAFPARMSDEQKRFLVTQSRELASKVPVAPPQGAPNAAMPGIGMGQQMALDTLLRTATAMLDETEVAALRLNLEPDAETFDLEFRLLASKATALSTTIADYGKSRNRFGALVGADSLLTIKFDTANSVPRGGGQPASDLSAFGPMGALMALVTTQLRGAEGGGLFEVRKSGESISLVAAIALNDSAGADQMLRAMALGIPQADGQGIQFDAMKVPGGAVHKVDLSRFDGSVPGPATALVRNPIFLALKDNYALVIAGEGSRETMTKALAANLTPKPSPLYSLELAPMKLMLMVLGDARDPGTEEKLTLTVKGGRFLDARFHCNLQLLAEVAKQARALSPAIPSVGGLSEQ